LKTSQLAAILLGEEEEERVKVDIAAGQFCLVNKGQAAFCRVVYDWSLLQAIGQNLTKLGEKEHRKISYFI
jgi:hypothetical protein